MVMKDTSAQARRRQLAVFASMSGPERVACAVEMAEEAKAITMAGIRSRLPELTDDEVFVEWLRLLHGDAVVDRMVRCSSSS